MQTQKSRTNITIPGACNHGNVHFAFSLSEQSALEQSHLFSSSANLSGVKFGKELVPKT